MTTPLCHNTKDRDLFFADDHGRYPNLRRAKQLCAACPIRSACLQAGKGEYGIWGGTTEEERRRLLSKTVTAVKPVKRRKCRNGHPLATGTSGCPTCRTEAEARAIAAREAKEAQARADVGIARANAYRPADLHHLPAEFTCGHPRYGANLIRNGKESNGLQKYLCKVCVSNRRRKPRKAAAPRRRDLVIGRAEELILTEHPLVIATALGYKSSVEMGRVLSRWGRRDLAERFVAA
jgi:hypothetical protein